MNGKSPTISHAPPFVLRLSKDERKVFQQNHNHYNLRTRRLTLDLLTGVRRRIFHHGAAGLPPAREYAAKVSAGLL